ncbi:MAG: MBOAT family protein [Pseudomonadota bacterium]
MLFFETRFLLSFAIFFAAYWALSRARRPLLIVLFSYVFYGAWDPRFLSLLLISTGVDFLVAQKVEAAGPRTKAARHWLWVSLAANLGMLGIFKYFDFFAETFAALFAIPPENTFLLNVILPAGISFYTFQTLGYVLDVYYGRQKAERDPITFAAFVSFFPQLVAGPIERAGDLIGQIKAPQPFSWANIHIGTRLFCIGLFKKLVIADNMAVFVDPVFADPAAHDPATLLFAAYAFSFQIYCDFSGYTDMARGIAKALGIDLSINFNLPYLATSVRQFWQRWHMTLYRWFNDYIYIPLGGSRAGAFATYRNILIVFTISGLWHGAGWNFIIWGTLHGLWICGERALAPTALGTLVGRLPGWVRAILVFHLITLTWIVFRAESLPQLTVYFATLADLRAADLVPGIGTLTGSFGTLYLPSLGGAIQPGLYALAILLFCGPLVALQIHRARLAGRRFEAEWPVDMQVVLWLSVAGAAYLLGGDTAAQFIYFQF